MVTSESIEPTSGPVGVELVNANAVLETAVGVDVAVVLVIFAYEV